MFLARRPLAVAVFSAFSLAGGACNQNSAGLQGQITDLETQRDEARAKAADLEKSVQTLSERIASLESERDAADARASTATRERDDALENLRATTVPPPAPASTADRKRYIYANSLCRYPMRILVLHRDSASPHHSHGWYRFDPYHESRLEANGVVLQQLDGVQIYAYAETITGPGVPSLVWAGTDAQTPFNGVQYNLRRLNAEVNDRGELEFQFSCST